jgi:hypothetical protein
MWLAHACRRRGVLAYLPTHLPNVRGGRHLR